MQRDKNSARLGLAERLEQPRVPSAKLHGMADFYKIKLRTIGYVYEVDDKGVVVTVIAVGKRDKLQAYRKAERRTKE